MKNYQACFFYEDLANSRVFLLWHARWERRLPPLPKNLAWPSMSSNPPHPPHKFAPKSFWPFWWEHLLCQLTSVWKPWTFFLSKLFLIITFLSDHFRSFVTLEMNKIVMSIVWNYFWGEFHISKHYFDRYTSELAKPVPLPYSHRKPTPYSDRLHDLPVIMPGCYKDDHVNSFFPATFGLSNSVPTEYFSLTCDLNDHKFRVNGTLYL